MPNKDLMDKYRPTPKLDARDGVRKSGEPKEGILIRTLPQTKVTSIVDFFDPTNLSHLEAYKCFDETGYFPDHFIPADVKLTTMWRYALASKLATLYVNEKINELTGTTLRRYRRD